MLIRRMTIKTCIGATVALLAALLVAISSLVLVGMNRMNSAYIDTFMSKRSVVNVGNSELYITRERMALDSAMLTGDAGESKKSIEIAHDMHRLSAMWWQRYADQPRGAEEDQLARAAVVKRDAFFAAADTLIEALGRNERARETESARRVQAAYDELARADDCVRQYQFSGAKERFDGVQATFEFYQISTALALGAGLLIAVAAWLLLSNAISRPIDTVVAHVARMATGDLSVPIALLWSNELGRLADGVASMQRSLTDTVRAMRASSETIVTASRQIAAGNTDLSARTAEQAAALQETASSMDQLTRNVQQNADNAQQANALATQATQIADQGRSVVDRVIVTMDHISHSSAKIADITSIIEGIAFQTNILALNAAVEAARAGEEGRGFAVVAGEVRSLAQRAGVAAKEIKALIRASVDRVQAGATLVESAGRTMTDVSRAVQRLSDIMGEISSASQAQSHQIVQLASVVTQMDSVTQQNAALVEEAAAGSQSLDDLAQRLHDDVAAFRLGS